MGRMRYTCYLIPSLIISPKLLLNMKDKTFFALRGRFTQAGSSDLLNGVPFPMGGLLLFICLILQMMPGELRGQINCGQLTCVSDPGTYKCIAMPPNVTVSIKDLIGTGTNDLLPMPQAATNAQKVIVSGWIKFDENYTFAQGSEIVFADGLPNDVNSGFIVTNGATLMLDSDKGLGKETYLFGCASLWRAIYVEANSTLDIRPGCGIFDAQNAIILRHHSTLLSNGATFQKNIISIRAIPGPNDPPKINVTTILKDNLFFGGSPLSEVFGPLHYPLEGIDAENVSQLSVVSDDPNKPNVFSYYREGTAMLRPIGINTVNTSLVVENARFEHIGLIPTPVNPDLDLAGYGIFAEADDNTTAQIYVKGFGIKGGAQPDPVAFEDVYTGIRARGMNVVIHNAQFKDASTPIELAATVLPRSYQIYNNRFSSYLIAGVSADRLFPTQGFNLYDNEFKDD